MHYSVCFYPPCWLLFVYAVNLRCATDITHVDHHLFSFIPPSVLELTDSVGVRARLVAIHPLEMHGVRAVADTSIEREQRKLGPAGLMTGAGERLRVHALPLVGVVVAIRPEDRSSAVLRLLLGVILGPILGVTLGLGVGIGLGPIPRSAHPIAARARLASVLVRPAVAAGSAAIFAVAYAPGLAHAHVSTGLTVAYLSALLDGPRPTDILFVVVTTLLAGGDHSAGPFARAVDRHDRGGLADVRAPVRSGHGGEPFDVFGLRPVELGDLAFDLVGGETPDEQPDQGDPADDSGDDESVGEDGLQDGVPPRLSHFADGLEVCGRVLEAARLGVATAGQDLPAFHGSVPLHQDRAVVTVFDPVLPHALGRAQVLHVLERGVAGRAAEGTDGGTERDRTVTVVAPPIFLVRPFDLLERGLVRDLVGRVGVVVRAGLHGQAFLVVLLVPALGALLVVATNGLVATLAAVPIEPERLGGHFASSSWLWVFVRNKQLKLTKNLIFVKIESNHKNKNHR